MKIIRSRWMASTALLLCGILCFSSCSTETGRSSPGSDQVTSEIAGITDDSKAESTTDGTADWENAADVTSETSAFSSNSTGTGNPTTTGKGGVTTTTAKNTSTVATTKTPVNLIIGDERKGELTDGVDYTFMNYDTGRWLGAGTATSFTLKTSRSGYVLWDAASKKYLNNNSGALTLDTSGTVFTVKHLNNGLYTMESSAGKYLQDNNGGTTNVAAIATIADGTQVSARWYITQKSNKQPLRIMPLGDSITEGCDANVDPSEYEGYRYMLWKSLSQSGLRFVFVGSVAGIRTQSDGLYRNEGHGGWTIDGTNGIANIVDRVNTKYDPDVILLQIGTNDCHLAATTYGNDMTYMSLISDKLENLLKKIYKKNTGCTIILAQIPPNLQGGVRDTWNMAYNATMSGTVETFSNAGNSIALVDNYTPLKALGASVNYGLSKDNLHPSATGYAEIAKSWSTALLKKYK